MSCQNVSRFTGMNWLLCTSQVPSLSPRQLRLLGQVAEDQHPENDLPDQDSVVQVMIWQREKYMDVILLDPVFHPKKNHCLIHD